MSAFLGPIHFWLYNKIGKQEELTAKIAAYAERKGWIEDQQKYTKVLPALEDVIDESNSFKECEIRSAVQQLPEKFRIIVELYYGEGCTIEEITKITGIKRSTVGDRLKRAREMLRKIYEEDQR